MNQKTINAVISATLSERGARLLKEYISQNDFSENEIKNILKNAKEFTDLAQLSAIVGKTAEYKSFLSRFNSESFEKARRIFPENKVDFIKKNITTLPNVKLVFASPAMKTWNDGHFNKLEDYYLIIHNG